VPVEADGPFASATRRSRDEGTDMRVAQIELQSKGENAESVISLTPEQLDTVAGGLSAMMIPAAAFVAIMRLLRLL
jgi:hypothetical protein